MDANSNKKAIPARCPFNNPDMSDKAPVSCGNCNDLSECIIAKVKQKPLQEEELQE